MLEQYFQKYSFQPLEKSKFNRLINMLFWNAQAQFFYIQISCLSLQFLIHFVLYYIGLKSMKKSISYSEGRRGSRSSDGQQVLDDEINPQFRKHASESSSSKIPIELKQSLVLNSKGKKKSQSEYELPALQKAMSYFAPTFHCSICETQKPLDQKYRIGQCQHWYCEECLYHYTEYRLGMLEKVLCPDETCSEGLKEESEFFDTLPSELKKRFIRNNLYFFTVANPDYKVCPTFYCEGGLLHLKAGKVAICSSCNSSYCTNCLYPSHEGRCRANEVDFMQNNLKYKRCLKCKNMIERSEGCSHMTCKCGFQFCYICGAPWTGSGHLCSEYVGVHHCFSRIDTTNCCGCFLAFILKILVLLPFWLIKCVVKLTISIAGFCLSIAVVAVISLCAGIRAIFDASGCFVRIVMVIFYPFTMFYGYGKYLLNGHCEIICALWEFLWQGFGNQLYGYFCW